MGQKIFCDTSFFIALYFPKDQNFQNATNIVNTLRKEKCTVITTDYVYDETLTFLLKTHNYHGFIRAKCFDQDIKSAENITMIMISDSIFKETCKVFFQYNKDKCWSFTDCVSFVVMKDFGIKRVLTYDKNFKQMGFKLHLKNIRLKFML